MATQEFRPGQLVFYRSSTGIWAWEKESGVVWIPEKLENIGLLLEVDDNHTTDRRVYVLFGETIVSVLMDTLCDVPKYIVNRK